MQPLPLFRKEVSHVIMTMVTTPNSYCLEWKRQMFISAEYVEDPFNSTLVSIFVPSISLFYIASIKVSLVVNYGDETFLYV